MDTISPTSTLVIWISKSPPKQKSSKTYPDTVDGKDTAAPGMYKTL